MVDTAQTRLVAHYEACLDRHGDSHLGVDWPRAEDADRRYAVMLDLARPCKPASLLDFGCGAAHFREYLLKRRADHLRYSGLDLSEKFVTLCRAKFPRDTFHCLDVLDDDTALPRFDYIVMNGVFTEKRELTFDAMWDYFRRLVGVVFRHADIGMALNVMSKQVDWERDDLFHVPMDALASFLTKEISRHFVFRSDYGLYEYTAYVYREPTTWPG